jgi:hypothetical protein
MKDFAITPHGNEFIRERNGMRFTNNYLDYMRQKVRSAISLFLGEWYLNRKKGIPYIPTSLEKIDHRPILETALIVTISNVKGIKKLISFEPSYDEKERFFKVQFVAQCENEEILEMDEDIPMEKVAA